MSVTEAARLMRVLLSLHQTQTPWPQTLLCSPHYPHRRPQPSFFSIKQSQPHTDSTSTDLSSVPSPHHHHHRYLLCSPDHLHHLHHRSQPSSFSIKQSQPHNHHHNPSVPSVHPAQHQTQPASHNPSLLVQPTLHQTDPLSSTRLTTSHLQLPQYHLISPLHNYTPSCHPISSSTPHTSALHRG